LEEIIINPGASESTLYVGLRWEAVPKLLPEQGVVIITDNNIFDLYGDKFPDSPVIIIKPGEESKQLGTIERLAYDLLKYGTDRSGFILGIGGGVVCDISGFLASVYMRGISFGFVSTSLLSQVDASTGGKNGVNLGDIKNMIGNFNQPAFVICDAAMLETLPEEEYLSGMAELIKTGIIGDPSIIDLLERNHSGIMKRDKDLLADLVARSVKYKASVVSADERESGLRRVLNFGHTFGHAIELHQGIKHGFAVAAGMTLSVYWSEILGYINNEDSQRIIRLLEKYKLIPEYFIPPEIIEELISHDKKKAGKDINFVFTGGLGKAFTRKIPVKEVIGFYRQISKIK